MKQWLLCAIVIYFLGVATGATFKVVYTQAQITKVSEPEVSDTYVMELLEMPPSEEQDAEIAMTMARIMDDANEPNVGQ